MLRYLKLCLLLISGIAFGAPPVIWGPSDTVQPLTSRGILIGNQLNQTGNYVLNPSAFVNLSNVSGADVTITRSTTTPISTEKLAEFNLNFTDNNGSAVWALSTFSQGLKGALCEARFRYRNATSTTKFAILQGSNVIAQVSAIVDSVNTTLGSIPFPCGDLSSATTFRASTTTTPFATALELADIYVGQVVSVGEAGNITPWQSYAPTVSGFGTSPTALGFWRRVGTAMEWRVGVRVTNITGATGLLVSLPSGYTVDPTFLVDNSGVSGLGGSIGYATAQNTSTGASYNGFLLAIAGGTQFRPYGGAAAVDWSATVPLTLATSTTYHFGATVPITGWASTNLAVTPGSQNQFGLARFSVSPASVSSTSATYTKLNSSAFASPTVSGVVTAASSTCGLAANDSGVCIPNLAPGSYLVRYVGTMRANIASGETATECYWSLSDGTTRRGGQTTGSGAVGGQTINDYISSVEGVFTYSAFQTNLGITLQTVRGGGTGSCQVVVGQNTSNSFGQPEFQIIPLSQANTTPVFIQSPVLDAKTTTAPLAGEVGEPSTAGPVNATHVATSTGATPIAATSMAANTAYYLSTSTTIGSQVKATISAGRWNCTGRIVFSDTTNSTTPNVSLLQAYLDNGTTPSGSPTSVQGFYSMRNFLSGNPGSQGTQATLVFERDFTQAAGSTTNVKIGVFMQGTATNYIFDGSQVKCKREFSR